MTEDAPVVRRAVFPVKVQLPDGTEVKLAKLFITTAWVYVFGNGPAGEPVQLYAAAYDDATLPPTFAPRSDLYHVTTADGELVATRLPGCGCSTRRLKNYQPWAPMRVGS